MYCGKNLLCTNYLSFLYPFSRIDEGFDPWRDLIAFPISWVISPLPWKDGIFNMRHHGQMTAVGRSDTGSVVHRSIWIGRITGITETDRDMVSALFVRKIELSFSVGHPNAKP